MHRPLMRRFLTGFGVLTTATAILFVLSRAATPPLQQIASAATQPAPADWAVEITYVANEGVLLSSRNKRVLIDGLHREYRTYPALPEPYLGQIETGQAPFNNIDLILVSHTHRDHFHPASVGIHLRGNPSARLVSSQQVVDELRNEFGDYATIATRVTPRTPVGLERVPMTTAGIDFEILRLSHGTDRHRDIQNLGHIVTLEGKKFLHVGDADFSSARFEAFNLADEGIDVAFLPMWFLTEPGGAAVVNQHIRPKRIVGVHAAAGERPSDIRTLFPGADLFTVLLEKIYLR